MKRILLILLLLPVFTRAQIITTFAGNGIGGFTGDGVPATATALSSPYGVGIDSMGNIYIGDAGNNRIRRIDTFGIIHSVAGTGVAGYNGDGIFATTAQLNFPYGMSVNRAGTIVIADMSNHRIRSIQSEVGGIIITIGGTGVAGFSGDGGPAVAAQINNPQGIFWDVANNVYFGDHYNHRIRKIDASGIITTIAGNGTPGYSGDGGPATAAGLYYPSGITKDNLGNIYIADMYNQRIRKIDTSGIISTVAGTGTSGYSGDGGPATLANLRYPKDVYMNNLGELVISDPDNQRLRKISTSGIITTFAGTGSVGFSGDGGPATMANLNEPQGVFVDDYGSIYLGDCLNNRIRKITCIAPAVSPILGPGTDTVCIGSSLTLTNSTSGGVWSCSNTNAIVSSTGIVTGVATGWDTIRYAVTNTCTATNVVSPVYVKSCSTTLVPSVNGISMLRLKIYPNPASSELTIIATNKINKVSINNLLGQTMYTHEYNTDKVQVDVADLPPGIYLIRINGTEIRKFVKQ